MWCLTANVRMFTPARVSIWGSQSADSSSLIIKELREPQVIGQQLIGLKSLLEWTGCQRRSIDLRLTRKHASSLALALWVTDWDPPPCILAWLYNERENTGNSLGLMDLSKADQKLVKNTFLVSMPNRERQTERPVSNFHGTCTSVKMSKTGPSLQSVPVQVTGCQGFGEGTCQSANTGPWCGLFSVVPADQCRVGGILVEEA